MSWLAERTASLGIDPGAAGALVLVDDRDRILWAEDMPSTMKAELKSDRGVDPSAVPAMMVRLELARKAADVDLVAVVVERVGAMPTDGGASAFKFGTANGVARTIAAFLSEWHGAQVLRPTPTVWKSHYVIGAEKAASCALATELFGAATLFWGPRGGPRDGMAEAALLARWGLRFRV